jgi:hypothetical protein
MKRFEVIANQSLKDELIGSLEEAIPNIEYTLITTVQGKGMRKRKEGTRTWPETNFLLISYLNEENAAKATAVAAKVRSRFLAEGLFASLSDATLI